MTLGDCYSRPALTGSGWMTATTLHSKAYLEYIEVGRRLTGRRPPGSTRRRLRSRMSFTLTGSAGSLGFTAITGRLNQPNQMSVRSSGALDTFAAPLTTIFKNDVFVWS